MSYSCPACSYAMDAFDVECPRCHGKGINKPTPPASSVASASSSNQGVTSTTLQGTTVLPRSTTGVSATPNNANALPIMRFTDPPERNPGLYIFGCIAYAAAYFAPWYGLKLVPGERVNGELTVEIISVVAVVLAAIFMILDASQGDKDVPFFPQARIVLSTGALAYALYQFIFVLMLTSVFSVSFGLPIMVLGGIAMVWIDLKQLGEDVRTTNIALVAAVLIGFTAFGAFRGNQVRQIADIFTGFSTVFGDSEGVEQPKLDVDVKVNLATEAPSLQPKDSSYSPTMPGPGKIFLICNVTATFNGGADSLNVDAAKMKMTASNKHIYKTHLYYQEFQNVNFLGGELLPGGVSTGDVVFEVDAGAKPEKIEYDP